MQSQKFLDAAGPSVDIFRTRFEREDFGIRHNLQNSPLMQMDALRDLCVFCMNGGGKYHFETNNAKAGDGFAETTGQRTLLDAFDSLNEGTLILLKSIHTHPAYAKLMKDFIAEVGDILGVDFEKRYYRPICTIILASPHRVTQYHIDDSENLLLQVQGTKEFYVFNGNDRSILSSNDLERYWGAGDWRVAKFSDAIQQKAKLYNLKPGDGVHVPLTFPHWVQNGPEISVAISINFQQRFCRQSNVSQINYHLRRVGLRPSALGDHPVIDSLKSGLLQTVRSAARTIRSART